MSHFFEPGVSSLIRIPEALQLNFSKQSWLVMPSVARPEKMALLQAERPRT